MCDHLAKWRRGGKRPGEASAALQRYLPVTAAGRTTAVTALQSLRFAAPTSAPRCPRKAHARRRHDQDSQMGRLAAALKQVRGASSFGARKAAGALNFSRR